MVLSASETLKTNNQPMSASTQPKPANERKSPAELSRLKNADRRHSK
jgi:hypothetical protein